MTPPQTRRILIAHYGENSPVDEGYRPQRYGQLARELTRQGHAVTRLLPGHQHLSSVQRQLGVCTTQFEGDVIHLVTRPYETSRGASRLRFLRSYVRALRRFALTDGERFDVVVLGCPPLKQAAAIRAFKRSNPLVRVVVDIRDLWPDAQLSTSAPGLRVLLGFAKPLLRRRARHMLRLCDGLTAVSPSYLDWAHAVRGTGTLPSAAIRIGAADVPTDDVVVDVVPMRAVFVGTLSHHFDFDLLVRGWRRMIGQLPDEGRPELIIVGDGPLFDAVAQLASDEPTITATGRLLPSEVSVLLQSAAIGIAPYARDSVMSSTNKIAEYASAGLPIVCSSSAAAMPSLTDGGLMRIVQSDDPDVYACHLAEAFRMSFEPSTRPMIKKIFHEELSEECVSRQFADFLLSDPL